MVRTEYRKVRVVGFFIFIAVSVDQSKVVFVVFLRDVSAGVLTESSYLVHKRLRISDKFGFVQGFVDGFHNFVAKFHPYAYVDDARLVLYVVLAAHIFEPVGALSSRSDYRLVGKVLFTVDYSAGAYAVFYYQIFRVVMYEYFHAVLEKVSLNSEIKVVRLFRTEMADRTINQFKVGLYSFKTDIFYIFRRFQPFDVRVRAEFEINFIGVVDDFLRPRRPYKFGEISPYFVA